MEKVIISVDGGVAEVVSAPDNVHVEIRDYDVPFDPSRPECYELDEDGRQFRSC